MSQPTNPIETNPEGPLILGALASKIPYLGLNGPFITGRRAAEIMSVLAHNGDWRRRKPAETDRTFRQVIPYILVTNSITGKYLVFERTPKQDESRLHAKISIGAGGHVERDDKQGSYDKIIDRAAARELKEETGFSTGSLTFAGVLAITDPAADEVHHVHIAAVYHLFTKETNFVGEEDKHIRKWTNFNDLSDLSPRMETWSYEVWKRYLTA